ncbi:carbohydrate ABC transporter permease [Microbacterium sp.]|uniref:carbohydrate ABC transporter permease n=1 Tax=Microbacterium sp. TaxID=51671 RepID=UPI0025FF6573|nr:carbohydrate ABC transporter permease [Microbacterium sp.]
MKSETTRRPDTSIRATSGRRRRVMVGRTLLFLLLSVLAVPFVYPTIWMIFAAFKPNSEMFATPPTLLPREWTLEGVERIFTMTPFAVQYYNSLYMAVLITAATVILAAMAGYAFARIRFRGSNLLFLVLISGLMIPAEVTIIPIFQWVSELGLMDNHIPIIVLYTFGPGSVVSVFIFRQYFLSLPVELEDAGRIDGLGRWGLFWRIALPLSGPAIATVSILKFLTAFNMYFEPMILLRSPEVLPVSVGITRFSLGLGEPLYNTQLGAVTLTIIPVLIVFLFAQRQFVEALARSGVKG